MLTSRPFKQAKPERKALPFPSPISGGIAAQVGDMVAARPKENPLRSEPYRRLVAMLPCAKCDIADFSQAAHPPPTGKGIKEDDRMCFPLCCTRPGEPGCHWLFDNYKLMPQAEMRVYAYICAIDTRETIEENGMWPDGLPKYEWFE